MTSVPALPALLHPGRAATRLRRCGWRWYANPLPAAGVLIERETPDGEPAILLLRRAVEPGAGDWDLPAGYLDPGESMEEAALREARRGGRAGGGAGRSWWASTPAGRRTRSRRSTARVQRDPEQPVTLDAGVERLRLGDPVRTAGWLPRMAFASMRDSGRGLGREGRTGDPARVADPRLRNRAVRAAPVGPFGPPERARRAAVHSIPIPRRRRDMADAHVKVAVTGAAGQIGYALLFRIASGQMFGPRTTVDLQLLELPAALSALDGVAMELDDCAFPLLRRVVRTANADEAFAGANWALLVGAVPRKQGMERKDLLTINGGIFTDQGRAIAANAADDVRVLVVGNPCNTNCLIAVGQRAGHPARPLVRDDHARREPRPQPAGPARPASRSTRCANLAIWGNHSVDPVPRLLPRHHRRPPGDRGDRGRGVAAGRVHLPPSSSAARRSSRRVASRARPAPRTRWSTRCATSPSRPAANFSAAIRSPGDETAYGVPKGIVFGYPLRATAPGRVEIVQGVEHGAWAQSRIDATLAELVEEHDAVKDLIP